MHRLVKSLGTADLHSTCALEITGLGHFLNKENEQIHDAHIKKCKSPWHWSFESILEIIF